MKYLFFSILSLAWPESHMTYIYHVKKENRDLKISAQFQPMWGRHSKFRVIPQSPVHFVMDPACGAFDLVVSVEV